MESLVCNFYLSVAARKLVWADPSLRYTRMFLGRWATNKSTSGGHVVRHHIVSRRTKDQSPHLPGSSPICDIGAPVYIETDVPVATLPGLRHSRISAGTGWFSVSMLWLSEISSLMCNFCLSVAPHINVWADPSLRQTWMSLDFKQPRKVYQYCSYWT